MKGNGNKKHCSRPLFLRVSQKLFKFCLCSGCMDLWDTNPGEVAGDCVPTIATGWMTLSFLTASYSHLITAAFKTLMLYRADELFKQFTYQQVVYNGSFVSNTNRPALGKGLRGIISSRMAAL
jgi:hypothetical protein